MSVVILVFVLVVIPFSLGMWGEVHFRRKRKAKKNTWKLEPVVVSAVRTKEDGTENKFDGVRFRARKRQEIMSIETPWEKCYALDPSRESFHENLAEYRAHAKEVVQTLNANDKMLESYR